MGGGDHGGSRTCSRGRIGSSVVRWMMAVYDLFSKHAVSFW